ncbi:TPA: hypothetical protein ACM9WY_004329 [Klebsiella pneumoniae]
MYKHLNISITLSDNSMTLRNDEVPGNLIRSAEVITKVSDMLAKGHCSGAFAVPVEAESFELAWNCSVSESIV